MELCTILGSPKANSYLTLEEADELMPLYDEDWTGRSEEQKIFLLIASANDVDKIPLLGTQMFFGQRQQWPRVKDVLVECYTLSEGFERAVVTDTITNEVVKQEPMGDTLKIGQDYAEVSITSPNWQPFLDNARVVVKGILPDGETEFAGEIRLEPYLHIVPEIKNEFGEVIHPAVEEERLRAVWKKFYKGTKYDRPLPEVPLPFPLPDIFWDEDTNTFRIYALNGAFFDPTTDIRDVVSEYTVTETVEVEQESRSEISNPALIITDRTDILPEYFAGGALHVIHGKQRDYHRVLGCDVETGTLKVTGEIYAPADEEEIVTYLYIDPIRQEVKDAQFVQLRARAGNAGIMTDPFAGMGLGSIQIGDTRRTYATGGGSYSALTDIANRLGVHVQTLAIMGKFSIYGKVSIGWQQRIEDALETPLGTE